MVIFQEKKMERLNSWDWKIVFGTNLGTLNIGPMKKWKSTVAKGGGYKKRFQYCTDLSGTRNSLSPSSSRSFRTQSHWLFIPECGNSGQFLRLHLSNGVCNQFTLHHKFRTDTGRTKIGQGKTDSVLYGCECFEQGTQRSVWNWFDRTTSCMVQEEKMEKTPRHGVLGRYTTCSAERIEVLSNKIERNHPLRHTPSLLYPEGFHDGNWWNHSRESIYIHMSPRPPT